MIICQSVDCCPLVFGRAGHFKKNGDSRCFEDEGHKNTKERYNFQSSSNHAHSWRNIQNVQNNI
eukprot:Awhi_evm1s12130